MGLRPLLLAALLAWLPACSRPRHSLLLITLDTVRADALGAYGGPSGLTPNLDRLAQEGLVFERASSVAPLTLPAHASLLTGLVPPRHGLRDNGLGRLPESAVTLAEHARAAGFQTAAFLGSVVLDAGFGLEQGFERYEAPARPFQQRTLGYAERPAREVVDLALEWLRALDSERPFFLWLHFWDAHSPYEPAPEFRARAGNNPYLGEIAAIDQALGRVLAELRGRGWYDSTTVIAVADHGEAFLEHDELSHGAFVWETTLWIPLIVRRPGEDPGRFTGRVSIVDVFPSALSAMGIELERQERASLDGRELLESPGRAYFESYYGYLNYGWHPLAGWIAGDEKYVHSSQPVLFDLAEDPGEERDRLAQEPEAAERARAELTRLGQAPVLVPDPQLGLEPELLRSLQALGYGALGRQDANVPAPLAYLELPSPLGRAPEQLRFQEAQGLIAGEKYGQAEALLSTIVQENPDHLFAWDRLALCRLRGGRFADAIPPLERVLAAGPGRADSWTYLGACRLALGEEERALEAFARALALEPNHVQALGGIVNMLEDAGLSAQARPFRERFEAVQSRP
jgi:arylsulfatase A-like enzyme